MYKFQYRGVTHKLILLALSCLLTSCSGGLIGTATGPSSGDVVKPTYQLRSLPSKLAPKIPKTLTATNDQASANSGVQTSGQNTETAKSWQKISPSLSTAELTRLNVQESLTLLDSVILTLLTQCSIQSDSCEIPAGTVQAQYTETVVLQLQALIGYEPTGDVENQAEIESPFQGKLGSWLTFGEIEYQRLNKGSFAHAIRIESLSLLSNRRLEMQWNDDASEVSYVITGEEIGDASEHYRYQNGSAGQQLTFHWNGVSGNAQMPVTFEVSAGTDDMGPVSFSAYLNGEKITGRASDEQAFASAMTYDEADFESDYFQESFSVSGQLIEFIDCDFDATLNGDCSLGGFDNDLSVYETGLALEEWDFGFAQVSVRNIPEDIFEFEIRAPNTASVNLLDAVYCHGFQYPSSPPVTETFCFVDPSVIVDAIVVGFNDWGEEILLEDAIIDISDSESTEHYLEQEMPFDI